MMNVFMRLVVQELLRHEQLMACRIHNSIGRASIIVAWTLQMHVPYATIFKSSFMASARELLRITPY